MGAHAAVLQLFVIIVQLILSLTVIHLQLNLSDLQSIQFSAVYFVHATSLQKPSTRN